MDELYSSWRAKNLLPSELAESVAALRRAYAELVAGEPMQDADVALRESCERLGLVIDE